MSELKAQVWPSDALRVAEAVSLHAFAGNAGKWCSFRLSDGVERQRHVVYDSYYDAVRAANWDRDETVYILIPPDGMPPKAAKACLDYQRQVHDSGFRIPAPEFADVMPTMPALRQDWARQIRYLNKRG